MGIDWLGVLKGSAFTAFCLLVAYGLLRSARQSAMRERNRTKLLPLDDKAFCREGNHYVRRDWCSWDGMFNGEPMWICHRHRLDRKRRAFSAKEIA